MNAKWSEISSDTNWAKDINNMVQLGNIDKQEEGTDVVRYFIGTYNKLEQAE